MVKRQGRPDVRRAWKRSRQRCRLPRHGSGRILGAKRAAATCRSTLPTSLTWRRASSCSSATSPIRRTWGCPGARLLRCDCDPCLPCLSRSSWPRAARAGPSPARPPTSTLTHGAAPLRLGPPPSEEPASRPTQGASGSVSAAGVGVPREPTRPCVRPLRRSLLLPRYRPTPRPFPISARTGLAVSSRAARPRPPAPHALASRSTGAPTGNARTMLAFSPRPTLNPPRIAPSTPALSMAATSRTSVRSSNARRSTPRAPVRTPNRRAGNAASPPAWAASARSVACRMTPQRTAAASPDLWTGRPPAVAPGERASKSARVHARSTRNTIFPRRWGRRRAHARMSASASAIRGGAFGRAYIRCM
jgi:hypothetical protein